MPTFPASKGVLVDKYAEIALFDAEQNQRDINSALKLDKHKQSLMKKALDEQVRVKQAAMLKERSEEREWLLKEQARVAIWNQEERRKIEEDKNKYKVIRQQREQQLREASAIRNKEAAEMRSYELGVLRHIHTDIQKEKAVEAQKRARDAENLRQVTIQNDRHVRRPAAPTPDQQLRP